MINWFIGERKLPMHNYEVGKSYNHGDFEVFETFEIILKIRNDVLCVFPPHFSLRATDRRSHDHHLRCFPIGTRR